MAENWFLQMLNVLNDPGSFLYWLIFSLYWGLNQEPLVSEADDIPSMYHVTLSQMGQPHRKNLEEDGWKKFLRDIQEFGNH